MRWLNPFCIGLGRVTLVTTALLGSLAGSVQAQSTGIGGAETLFTSSSAYCSPPEAILINALDFKFFRENRTLEFDFSAASVQEGLEVIIEINVNAYGLGLFSLTLDVCDTIEAICPLPNYNFQGIGVFDVPETFVSEIPTIAYTVPNLEAVATVQLTDRNNGQVVGCIQTTLSNGKSVYQTGAKWAGIGVFILAGISSVLHTAMARSLGAAQWRVVDVLTSIQHICLAALLNLTYPQVFIEFARNFAWSIGLINIGPVQSSIESTRLKTGGEESGTFGKLLTAQTGRRFNPFSNANYVQPSTFGGIGGISLFATSSDSDSAPAGPAVPVAPLRKNLIKLAKPIYSTFNTDSPLVRRQTFAPYTGPGGRIAETNTSQQLPLININGTSPTGLKYFVETNDIPPESAYLTVLVSFAMLFAIVVAICLLAYALAALLRIGTRHKTSGVSSWAYRFTRPREYFGTFCRALFGRYMMMTWQVLLVFAFAQWLIGDSWVPDILAAIFVAIYLLGFFLLYFPAFRYARRGSNSDLYYGETPPAVANPIAKRWGPIAHPFRPKYFWFGLVILLVTLIRACFIGFVQSQRHGMRQAVGLAATDVLFFLVLCICRPGRDKTSDFVMILLTIFRILSWGVNIAFTPEAGVTTIPRVIVGFAQIVVTGLPVIFLFFLTVWDLISPFIRRRQWKPAEPIIQDSNREQKNAYSFGAVGAGAAGSATETTFNRGSSYSGVTHDASSSSEHERTQPQTQAQPQSQPMQNVSQQPAATGPSYPRDPPAQPMPPVDTGAYAAGGAATATATAARPQPVHADSAVSSQSGNTVYYDARQQA